MFRFSRSMYRDLAPLVAEGETGGCDNKQRVLDACEETIRRLAYDHRYFARPQRTLFREIRSVFPIATQQRVYDVIDRHITLACEYLDRQLLTGFTIDGRPLACHAQTRAGTPCQRKPRPGSDYCPSHRHLEDFDRRMDEMARAQLSHVA